MEKQNISLTVKGTLVEGEIVEKSKFYIRVRITSPFKNWENSCGIKGPGRQTPHHYLTERGDEVAKDLLLNAFNKLKIIDKSINRLAKVQSDLEEELNELKSLKDSSIKERIASKLNSWFYDNALFSSRSTGMIATYGEKEKIEGIFKIYRETGEKLYLT
ncbi:hypothetical protein [Christiangramia sabulilitoris]|uniref:Uncharacterized protein n=1 Tax=Christiangramia sabulilitoris TaxID=2583991 RepID=A0A550I7K2_9FLAO|nr:hypothetical protein [Christiangramia sabulilitoris]TRO66950.1 hypothetical protein FGM01_03405 [Christiangramia sabulilitoris]